MRNCERSWVKGDFRSLCNVEGDDGICVGLVEPVSDRKAKLAKNGPSDGEGFLESTQRQEHEDKMVSGGDGAIMGVCWRTVERTID